MLVSDQQTPASLALPARALALPDGAMEAHIAYYESVPAFIVPELERLYRHINCSFSHFLFRRRAEQASTYVASRGGRIAAIFVHTREKQTVHVLNEMVALDSHDIAQFAHYIFGRFASVARISFSAIGKALGRLPFPSRQYGGSEDIVTTLPATADAYFSSLSSKTRQNIKHRLKTLSRDHPRLQFSSWHDGDIDPAHVRALIELKRTQFRQKGLKCGIEADEAAWIAEQAQSGGLATIALLDGRVCGGSVSLRIGNSYFATLAAYDAAFAKHGLGMLCCYLTIREKIARGAARTHLGWGRNEYKFKLLGVRHDMANLDIYRSRLALLGQADRVLGLAAMTRLRQAKLYLLEHESDPGLPGVLARPFVRGARALKRSRFAPES